MESNNLTGIERELVLQYLIDGNVPVTVTPIDLPEENNSDGEKKNKTGFIRCFSSCTKR